MEFSWATIEQLRDAAEAIKRGDPPGGLTVREFLSLWGAQRRGVLIVKVIRRFMATVGLVTVPDFEDTYLDATITLQLAPIQTEVANEAIAADAPTETSSTAPDTLPTALAYADPTYRLSKLAAANHPPVRVRPDSSLSETVTVMLANQFSQLPVMTTERDLKGVVSWQSIGTRLALGQTLQTAQDAMEAAAEIRCSSSLFAVLPVIAENDYVLVRGADRRVVGIVTASDIAFQFQQLAEPFLLLGEIESHLRRVICASFTTDDFNAIRDRADPGRTLDTAEDLTFGDYRRLFEEPGRWARSKLKIDRSVFIRLLDDVRSIRNEVMHFDPDGVPPDDLKRLRDFASLLRTLQAVGGT